MKMLLLLLAAAATTLGATRAQTPVTASSPQGSTPNYKPAPGTNSPAKHPAKPAGGAAGKVVVRSGGQGHNSGPDPKGKILVAPSVTTQPGKGAAKAGKQ